RSATIIGSTCESPNPTSAIESIKVRPCGLIPTFRNSSCSTEIERSEANSSWVKDRLTSEMSDDFRSFHRASVLEVPSPEVSTSRLPPASGKYLVGLARKGPIYAHLASSCCTASADILLAASKK